MTPKILFGEKHLIGTFCFVHGTIRSVKIAFLSFYSGQIDRGVEVSTLALAHGLSKRHTVTLFQAGSQDTLLVKTVILSTKTRWVVDSSTSPLRFFYLDYYSRRIAFFTLQFFPYFLKEKYDVIIPTNGGWQVVFCRLITWIFGKKMLIQGNAGIGKDDFFSLLCLPNYYIAISPAGFKWAQKKTPWVKSSYISHGVDIQLFRNAKPAKIKLKKPIVLCVSAFIPYKQINLLIKAMSYVKDARLLIIGHGPEEERLQKMGKELLKERFLLRTGINHSELAPYYKTADVFSLPSAQSEALGIVYIEAMAAGLPVVAPDDENRHALIGNAGVFMNPHDEKAYAQAINRALKKNFGTKPQKQAETFSWGSVVKQYESVLKTI